MPLRAANSVLVSLGLTGLVGEGAVGLPGAWSVAAPGEVEVRSVPRALGPPSAPQPAQVT